MTTMERRANVNTGLVADEQSWVIDVLESDDLKLANAKRAEPYGRADLKPAVRIVLWAMRLYVLLSIILIATQIYISLK